LAFRLPVPWFPPVFVFHPSQSPLAQQEEALFGTHVKIEELLYEIGLGLAVKVNVGPLGGGGVGGVGAD